MAETKFTPGPWEWAIDEIDRGAKRGTKIRKALWTGKTGSGHLLHPSWNEFDGGLWQAWVGVSDADAALIAAAPDLYEAADEVDEFGLTIPLEGADEKVVPVYMTIGTVKKFRAALLKARGEQP